MDGRPTKKSLQQGVYALMAELPADKVTTYGDLAAMLGSPRSERIVGGIAHSGPEDLPWHRLVNAKGGLAVGFPGGGRSTQSQLLAQDDISCDKDLRVIGFEQRRWRPSGDA